MSESTARPLRRLFYAGRHQEVLARTLDGADGDFPPEETAPVIGSLSLLGRVDEALACFGGAAEDPAIDAADLIEARFFVIVGLCHAGRYGEARAQALENLRHRRVRPQRPSDHRRERYFVFQGAALVRYFEGRVRHALPWVKRALAASVEARFNYGRLLALDLWGHVLVQLGDVSAGLRTLGQAERLALSLEFAGHATSIACSRLVYQSRHGRGGADLDEELVRVAATSTDNLFALRSAWLELAFRAAIGGDAARAQESLDRAAAQAVPEQDSRALSRLMLTRAIVRRIDHSVAESAVCVRRAFDAARAAEDRILQAEVCAWDMLLGTNAAAGELADASALARDTGSLPAHALAVLRGELRPDARKVSESPLWSLLLGTDQGTQHGPAEKAQVAIERGWLGLGGILLGGEPGSRILLLEGSILADDHGVLVHAAKAPGHAVELLRVLAEGEQSKESLLRRVWGVARYSPAHHDAVIYTAIARLRRSLGPSGEWVRTSALGYALAPGVVVHSVGEARAPAPKEQVPSEAPPPGGTAPPESRPPRRAPTVESVLVGGEPLRSIDIAERVGISEATALRRLRALVLDGIVAREGAGKGTRYRLT